MAVNQEFINTSKAEAPVSRGGAGATAQQMIETGAPFAGAIFGGAIGATSGLLTGGTTSIPGAMIGAGLGSAAGVAVAEFTRPFLTGEQTPFEEQIRREIQMGFIEGMSEGAVPAAGNLIGMTRRALKSRIIGETLSETAKTARNVFDKAKQFGAELSLGQITGGEGASSKILLSSSGLTATPD